MSVEEKVLHALDLDIQVQICFPYSIEALGMMVRGCCSVSVKLNLYIAALVEDSLFYQSCQQRNKLLSHGIFVCMRQSSLMRP